MPVFAYSKKVKGLKSVTGFFVILATINYNRFKLQTGIWYMKLEFIVVGFPSLLHYWPRNNFLFSFTGKILELS